MCLLSCKYFVRFFKLFLSWLSENVFNICRSSHIKFCSKSHRTIAFYCYYLQSSIQNWRNVIYVLLLTILFHRFELWFPLTSILFAYKIEDFHNTESIDPLEEFFTESLSWPVTIKLEDALSYLLQFQTGFLRSVRSLTHSVATQCGLWHCWHYIHCNDFQSLRVKVSNSKSLRSFSHFRPKAMPVSKGTWCQQQWSEMNAIFNSSGPETRAYKISESCGNSLAWFRMWVYNSTTGFSFHPGDQLCTARGQSHLNWRNQKNVDLI